LYISTMSDCLRYSHSPKLLLLRVRAL